MRSSTVEFHRVNSVDQPTCDEIPTTSRDEWNRNVDPEMAWFPWNHDKKALPVGLETLIINDVSSG